VIRLVVFAASLAGCTSVVNFDTPRESGEQCSDGVDNDGNGALDCEDPGCAGTIGCLGCGDGTVDVGEECDDRNTLPNDGCSAVCRIEVCGDGDVNPGEACDDGNADDTDGCLTNCASAICGDGVVQDGVEQCDDSNAATDDGCTPGCLVERCGDGTAQAGPVIQFAEFLWLASSCAPSGPIQFTINGSTALLAQGDLDQSCTCAPSNGFRVASGETPPILDGFNDFSVEYTGADQFLAWAMVILHTTAGDREIVIFEGVPGAAAARATSMCVGGFDENVPVQAVSVPVSVFEQCDDGNQVNDDACANDCRENNL
jgi:cysteine-rich repeat protein